MLFLKILGLQFLALSLNSAQSAKTFQIFYFDVLSDQKCVATLLEIPSKKTMEVFSASACPDNLIWDTSERIIYYTQSGRLYSRPASDSLSGLAESKNEKSKDLGPLPEENVTLFLEKETNTLLIAYLVPLKEKQVRQFGLKENRKEVYTFENKKYDASQTPTWGLPYMAILAKLEKGKWKRLQIEPTKSAAGDTPGVSVLKKVSSKGFVLKEVMNEMSCFSGLLVCDLQDKKILKLLKLAETDNHGRVQTKSGNQFVFAAVFGHSPHAVPPVYFCKEDCETAIELKSIEDRQLAFGVQDDYVLVTSEYSNQNLRVFDGNSGQLIYESPRANSAVWFKEKLEN